MFTPSGKYSIEIKPDQFGGQFIPQIGQLTTDNTNVPSQNPTEDAFLKGHPVLKGISDFVGTTGLAKGLSQGIFLKFTPEGQNLLKMVQEGKMTTQDIENSIGKPANAKEIYGSALQTFSTIASAGIGKATAFSVGGRILQTAGKIGGVSALSGAGQAMSNDQNLGGIAKSSAISGLSGALLGGAGQAIGELAKFLTSPATRKSVV